MTSQTEAPTVRDLINDARREADRRGIRNPSPTLMADETLRFWNERDARDWLRAAGFEPAGPAAAIGPAVVMAVQIGPYQQIVQWPSKEHL